MNTRLCPTCKRTIEVTRSLDGLYSYCAHCNREYHTPGRFNEQALYDADILSEDETQEQPAVEPTLIDWLQSELNKRRTWYDMMELDSMEYKYNKGQEDMLLQILQHLTPVQPIVIEDTDNEN